MSKIKIIFIIFILIATFIFSKAVLAENKFSTDIIPKLTAEEMKDAPELYGGDVYPAWGVPCTNFTYFVTYRDKQDRAPEYVRISLNGQWHDMEKQDGDYKNGVQYTYNLVPDSGRQLFYYYEASNGFGKARTSIIDTPDQGPSLYSEKLDNNQIILLDKQGEKVWSFAMGRDWTEGVAISADGDYVAAVTNINIHLFSKNSSEPLWTFCKTCELPDVVSSQMEGVAISADGNYIAGTMRGNLYFFEKKSNKPLWSANIETGAIGIDMSNNAEMIAVGVAQAGENGGDKLFLFNKQGKKILEYKPEVPDYNNTGDFYQPDVTPDGRYISASTGCPDRRGYLFSQSQLIFRSNELAKDSPVHKSAISDDGSLIAYSADNMDGKEIVFLFNKDGQKLWSFASPNDSTARAVTISGDGNYIAAGTSKGNIYLFSKNSNKPLWTFSKNGRFMQFGDIKLNADGSLLAAGGTTKKVYLFSKESNKPLWEYQANTWVTKIDFNGEYVIAGTGPREYFMEGQSLTNDQIVCQEIIQPPPFSSQQNFMAKNDQKINGTSKSSYCDNGICEGWAETYENCPQDCCAPPDCVDDIDDKEATEGVLSQKKQSWFVRLINFFRRLLGIK